MHVRIADKSQAAELADFFCANVTTDFISHSELQGYRAKTPDRWSANLSDVVLAEITERLAEPRDQASRLVIESRDQGVLVALALLSLSFDAAVPFAVLEDLVVGERERGKGHGKEMMSWIVAFVREKGIERMFLESGARNTGAHHFFERIGFRPLSIVMMWDIAPPA